MGPCLGCPRAMESKGVFRDDVRGKWSGNRGSPNSDITIVGQSPGKDELLFGSPFVGESGEMLDRCFRVIGRRLEDCFILNACNCYPIDANDKLSPEQKSACFPRVRKEFQDIGSGVILMLGSPALEAVTGWGPRETITSWRGYPIAPSEVKTKFSPSVRWIIGSFHPAFVMRKGWGPLPWLRRDIGRAVRLLHDDPTFSEDPGQCEVPTKTPSKLAFDIETAGFYGAIRRISFGW